jgi:hypothetical protein
VMRCSALSRISTRMYPSCQILSSCGIAGFAHLQYLDGNGLPNYLTCCTPIEFPVKVVLGSAGFISEDVYDVNQGPISNMYSETPIQSYYKLLNSGFRPGFAATDYPCNGGDSGGAWRLPTARRETR